MRFANENRGHHLKELLFSWVSFLVANPIRLYGALAALLLVTFLVGAWYGQRGTTQPGSKGERKILYYVDPMNPAHTSPEPGLAPCGMKMEPVFADEVGQTPDKPLLPGAVKVTPQKQQLIGVKVAQVEKAPYTHHLRVLGKVAADETLVYRLNAAVNGWIIDTFDKATGSVVNKDEVLATYYSPDFLAAQQSYIFALNQLDRLEPTGGPEPPEQFSLIRLNLHRSFDALENLGMSLLQINELSRTRQYSENILLVAPATSFILARNVSPGQRFDKGTEWYRLADLSRVWIMADLYEHEAQYIHPGDKVVVRYPYQEKMFSATVSDVPPQFDPATRTLRVRLVTDNPGYHLRPDMFVDATLPIHMPPAITVPVDAILDSGFKKTVFVDRGQGYFEPRQVETGWRLGDRVEVTQGLSPGEKIVISGNFLIDSESRMKLAAAGMLGEVNQDPVCGRNLDETKARAAGHFKEIDGKTYYFCSSQCQKTFEMVPERYASQKGQASGLQSAKHGPENSDTRGEAKAPEKPNCCPAAPKARDPVCGMEIEAAKAKEAGHQSDVGDKTYYFCRDYCKEQFDKDPQRYQGQETSAQKKAGEIIGKSAAAPDRSVETAKTPAMASGNESASYETSGVAGASPNKITKDPVCGRAVEVAESEAAGWKTEHRGKTYYFCRDSCKMYFDKKPDFYASGPDVAKTQALPHPFHHFVGKMDDYSGRLILDPDPKAPTNRISSLAEGETAKDPVCGMNVGERLAQGMGLKSEYQGKTYFFCSKKCKEMFDQNPEQRTGKIASTLDQGMTKGPLTQGMTSSSIQTHPEPESQVPGAQGQGTAEKVQSQEMTSDSKQTRAMHESKKMGAQGKINVPKQKHQKSRPGTMKDPVCGMEVEIGKARESGRQSVQGNRAYFFCSDKCKLQFEKNPKDFLKNAGEGRPHAQHKPSGAPTGGHPHD